ncbi:MAG: DNA polymerase I, partial [Verrucomicrobia bacterium]|nr:DNA polymerase I [Verrucomicrobiota bacterium]
MSRTAHPPPPFMMNPVSQPRLLILDGHAYAYRAFYAIRHLTSPTGAPTNAIYGFIKMLAKLRAALQPTHLAVAWDGGLAAERTAAWPEYKAQRPPMPDDLERQLDPIVAYLEAAAIFSLCHEGIEADDWIATLARAAQIQNLPVVIASSDKDFMQLVSPAVGLVNPHDKHESVWTAEQVHAKTGVAPAQVVDWLSLIGDTVDNIPGVPGVGPKTAADLLQQFGSVSAMFARLNEVKSEKLRASLLAGEALVRRNQQLVRLKDDLPLDCTLADLAARP